MHCRALRQCSLATNGQGEAQLSANQAAHLGKALHGNAHNRANRSKDSCTG